MFKKTILLLFVVCYSLSAQTDTIPGETEYRKHYDCRYEKGNILIVQKKGKTIAEPERSFKPENEGFVMRMEAIYDLEFADGKRFKSGVIKNITADSISITSTMNERCAQYEGIKYETFTYPIKDLKIARFINDRTLGFFSKKKMKDFDLIVREVDKAKLCPALLTFTKRNNEVKVCHYYLTDQGYNILYETDGYLDYMEYPVEWE